MDRLQQNKNTMGTSVAQTNKNNESLFSTNDVFKASAKKHDDNLITINALAVKQQNSKQIDGLIHDKNMLRALMAILGTRIISGIKAYAASINNEQLIKSVPYSQSYLARTSDEKALLAFIVIKDVAVENKTEISTFGVSSTMTDLLISNIADFKNLMEQPKTMKAAQKDITNSLKLAFAVMMLHLKSSLDQLVKSNFMETTYAEQYFNARKIYKTGNNSTILRGTVSDPNGHKIRQALVELIDYPTPGTSTMRLTDSKGNYAYKKLTLTTAKIRVQAANYATATFTVTLVKDKENEFQIQLIPAPLEIPVLA